jgi:hypothetical protein
MNHRAVITDGLRDLGAAATRRGAGGLEVLSLDIAGGMYVAVDIPDGNPYLSAYSVSKATTAPEVLDHIPALTPMKRLDGSHEMAELLARVDPDPLSFSTRDSCRLSCTRATHKGEGVPA